MLRKSHRPFPLNPSPIPSKHYALYGPVKPDDHLACFDALNLTGVREVFEWEKELTPVWDLVGVRLHYKTLIEDMAMEYIRRAFGMVEDDEEPLPPVSCVLCDQSTQGQLHGLEFLLVV